jgi:hypothetical protein
MSNTRATGASTTPFRDFLFSIRENQNYFVRVLVGELINNGFIPEPQTWEELEAHVRDGVFVSRVSTAHKLWDLYQRAKGVEQGGAR